MGIDKLLPEAFLVFFRDVMRDLTRLLYILNKKPEAVRIPPDGIPLLDWSEQILNRYLTAQVNYNYTFYNNNRFNYIINNNIGYRERRQSI